MVTQNKGRILVCKRYSVLLTGVMILSFGLFNIHSQSKITEGGILGLTLFLKHWFHISPGISEFVLDLLCYLAGLRILGKSFLKNALISSAGYALFYSLWEFTGPFLPNLGHRPLFAAVVGGLFVGVGVGLVVRAGGATGGDDALALILSRKTPLTLSKAYLFTDVVVLLLSATYIPLVKIGCSLVTVTISSILIGKIQAPGKFRLTCSTPSRSVNNR